jgi:arginyl-tRNA synthetase
MKNHIAQLLTSSITTLKTNAELSADVVAAIQVSPTKDKQHGDFASNIALLLAKPAGINPREMAKKLIAALPESPHIKKVEVAGPGFINFFLNAASIFAVIPEILSQGAQFGHSDIGKGKKIQVEFVSANPTGPLHVGHGRGAAYGSSVADLLEATGHDVTREYYVNDAGRQMNILAVSVWLRYIELCGQTFTFPSNGYKGMYVRDISSALKSIQDALFNRPIDDIFKDVPADEPQGGDKETHIDALIERAKSLLGDDYLTVFNAALNSVLDDIKEDLTQMGVTYQSWFSEKSLADNHAVEKAIQQLQTLGHVYEKDGALWFASTVFGDDKDRVVKRDNGETTYFASDIAYHINKFERGFDEVINIWGADHHGYIPRVKAALQALQLNPNRLDVRLVQFAILYRGQERVQMSTRSGSFVTLRELREEVGNDATRFFYVMRKSEQHMDFDLELAKSHSKDNPVYYIQYAHARICSVLRKVEEQGLTYDQTDGVAHLDLLNHAQEQAVINRLTHFTDIISQAALAREPHQLANYLRDLAGEFHTYYNDQRMMIDEKNLRNARLSLSMAVRQVIKNGLTLLGVSSPEVM